MTEEELNKISYQLDSWKRFKWEPDWLGVKRINVELFPKVIAFQKTFLHPKCDGFIDSKTYELLFSITHPLIREKSKTEIINSIILFRDIVNIKLAISNQCLTEAFVTKEYQLNKNASIDKIIVSYAYTYSAKAYSEIMKNKKTACHFAIDFSGLVTQFLDPMIESNDDTDIDSRNSLIIKIINPLTMGKYDNLIAKKNITMIDTEHYYNFTNEQIESLMTLLNKLTYACSVPMRLINESNKKGVFVEDHIFADQIKNQLP